ncbi:MAG: hypothetical protein GC171_03005 [Terrimonas sp.]|nr:hypothetical protein [Terrimonas sp.]
MNNIEAEELLIIFCSLVVLSYLFSIIGKYLRLPSVLLLLFTGMGIRAIADTYNTAILIPNRIVEALGVVGLIMIVLEAGLDLKIEKAKLKLIRNSFLSALIIFLLSVASLTALLNFWLNEENILNCIIYAIPLSIISSAIVLPSLHTLNKNQQEFLVYEASFSDIIGILAFNYFIAEEIMTWKSFAVFGGGILVSIILSLVLSLVLFLILAKVKLNIKFFLIFSLLILLYAGGKLLHLPSLLIIMIFGLLINNWDKMKWERLTRYFPESQISPLHELLHSITAESSFLIRTFFFILFGYSIDLHLLMQEEVIAVGLIIVFCLLLIRFLYLRFFVKTNVFPELFFMPRGLITIVLFYKIPQSMKLHDFNDGILFFVILTTSIIMALGMIFYKKKPDEIVEERQFVESEIF